MSPEVKKAIELKDCLYKLLHNFNLISDKYIIEINVYDLINNNNYLTKAGLCLREKNPWVSQDQNDPLCIKTLMERIEKFADIKLNYEIETNYCYPICFFDIADMNKLHDKIYPLYKLCNN